jgi:hypothetical protein
MEKGERRMISGKITLHKEPEKIQSPMSSWYTNYMEDGYDDVYSSNSYHNKRADQYKEILKKLEELGVKEGTRVLKLIGTKVPGTVTQIHKHHTMAWNYHTGVFEPVKVKWDDTPNRYQDFDYSIDEFEVLKDETVSNLPIAG